MPNEGSSISERTAGFLMRLLVSLVLPNVGSGYDRDWRKAGEWMVVATGIAVLAIGVVFFAGSSLVSPFLWRPPLLLMNLVFAGLVHAAWGPVC